MIRPVCDPRVLGPLLAGVLVFGWRAATREPPAALPAAVGTPITLPLPVAWKGPANGANLALVPGGSQVRFSVDTGFRTVTASCPLATGTLGFGRNGTPTEVELRFDLQHLRAEPDDDDAGDLTLLLGVRRGDAITFRGQVQAVETFATAGIQRVTFLGTLAFGPQRRQQPMQLWLTMLAPGTVRLQGQGTVDGHDFGLPRRRLAGMLPERSRITVALDLAFGP